MTHLPHPRNRISSSGGGVSGQYLPDLVVPGQGLTLRLPLLKRSHIDLDRVGQEAGTYDAVGRRVHPSDRTSKTVYSPQFGIGKC